MPLEHLNRLVGTWTTEATHPLLPGVIVRGTSVIEWLAGERFLIVRDHAEHPDFPDAISIIGVMGRDRVEGAADRDPDTRGEAGLEMHTFDSRGVSRVYEASIDDRAWRFARNAPGFSQRFVGTFADGGATIDGVSQLCRDDVHWEDDLRITYRRTEP